MKSLSQAQTGNSLYAIGKANGRLRNVLESGSIRLELK